MSERFPRDGRGRFVRLVCVNAHDLCFQGGPCPYCEPAKPALFPTTPEATDEG